MTVSSTVRRAGPFTGNGSTSTFPFSFIALESSDVLAVTLNVASGVQTTLVLNTDYSVSLNVNQNSSPGGSITLLAGNLAAGYSLVISTDAAQLQGTELVNQGGFDAETLTDALDLLTILVQQLQEQLNRALTIPITDTAGLDVQLPSAALRAGMYLTFDSNGVPQTSIATPGANLIGFAESISTANQTVFTTPHYTPGSNNLFVICGGLVLTNGVDYTETSTTSITLTQPSDAGLVYTFRSITAV